MRSAIVLLCALGCHSSSSPPPAEPALAIVGHGVQLVPSPGINVALLPNGALIFGPRAEAPGTGAIKNVAVKPGKPPTVALAPHAVGEATIYSDGAADTTAIMTGVGMTSFDGVLKQVSLSKREGPWTVVADGKDQAWSPGTRLEVADDGRTFKLVAKP
jgi:hypothetical protein